jgi:hypothetical protein
MSRHGAVRFIQAVLGKDSLSAREREIVAHTYRTLRNVKLPGGSSIPRADAHPGREAAALESVLADVARVRSVLRSRAARLLYTLGGRHDPAVLSQVEAYEDAAAELEDLLTASDRGPTAGYGSAANS